jgi:hypothetical protein
MFRFWYRESPRPLFTTDFVDQMMTPGMVSYDEPAQVLPGMINMELDPQGRLTQFRAVPPEFNGSASAPKDPDWRALFEASGLDLAQFQTTEPQWTPRSASDKRAAWTGVLPGTNRPLRVEAAAWNGTPVYFWLIGPWITPQNVAESDSNLQVIILISIVVVMLTGAALMARHNLARGRGERRGAFYVARFIFIAQMIVFAFKAHIPLSSAFGLTVVAVATSLFWAAAIWLIYIAVEPYVRRHWPQTTISWNRLVTGRTSDPLIGRDVLFGVMLGLLWVVVFHVATAIDVSQGTAPRLELDYLKGLRGTLGELLGQVPSAVQGTMTFFFMLFLLRLALRKAWLTALVFTVLWAAFQSIGSTNLWIQLPLMLVVYGILSVMVVRFGGLMTLAVGMFTANVLLNLPATFDTSAWYFPNYVLGILSVLALALWGFRTALAGQPLWKDDLV